MSTTRAIIITIFVSAMYRCQVSPTLSLSFFKLTLLAESSKVCILHLCVIFVCFLFQVLEG